MEFLAERYNDELEFDTADSNGVVIHVVAMEGHVRVIEVCVSMGGNLNLPDWVDSATLCSVGRTCGMFVGMLRREGREGQGGENNIFSGDGEARALAGAEAVGGFVAMGRRSDEGDKDG
ncbi:hypothetical protein Fmac_018340 [Flemingia macrophylla]|uniref:Uncharacterized protein n=1 Tax=Flemingia macrophylla TaxID=520843 RepID=A0ABD1M4P9_9FABA